ncbi:hypothetical protein BGZ99_006791 [Dissophora globulifera]|uniref:Uncharacterized protein n=1 Tax=Dissophora globulifera TaxID=979702 RepID=A0A9P6UZF6_9FUNG|nr:hypothetical protein BGZ99_006791 [Dissophora globulifera]
MKSLTALCAVLASAAALAALAEGFIYPTNPIGSTVWEPNTTMTISWAEDKHEPLLADEPIFDIFLMTGADDHQIKLASIAPNVKGGSMNSVKYRVPYVSPPGQNQKATAWTTRFSIADASGNPGNLHPTIPAGSKINPGGIGALIAAPSKEQLQQEKEKQPQQQLPPGKGPAFVGGAKDAKDTKAMLPDGSLSGQKDGGDAHDFHSAAASKAPAVAGMTAHAAAALAAAWIGLFVV